MSDTLPTISPEDAEARRKVVASRDAAKAALAEAQQILDDEEALVKAEEIRLKRAYPGYDPARHRIGDDGQLAEKTPEEIQAEVPRAGRGLGAALQNLLAARRTP